VVVAATGIEALCGGSGLGLELGIALMWGLMAATMMLPCAVHDIAEAARHGWRSAARLALVCIAPTTVLAIGLGLAWTPMALGTPALLAIAGIALVAEAALPAWPMRLGAAVAMVALQLIGGMELGWMALSAIWMLALALAPARRLVTLAAGAALLGLAVAWSL
jgi:predicted metal-binding membrane protein